MEEEQIKVLLVDDHSLFRSGVKDALSTSERIKVVGEALDGKEGVDLAKELKPDIILMDIRMPRMNGLDATVVIQKELPECSVVILTVSEEDADLFNALRYGAKGYLLKDIPPQDLISSIIHVAEGDVMLTPSMASKMLNEFKYRDKRKEAQEQALSAREIEILQHVAQGSTNKQIAEALFISENTAKVHLRNIMDKLHIRNRAEATSYAIRMGLV
ncbi:MAG: response regulator [Chloroflexota bacterium]